MIHWGGFLVPPQINSGIFDSESTDVNQRIRTSVNKIITEKKTLIKNSLNDTRARYFSFTGDTTLIASDLFNAGYMIFEGVKAAIPMTAKIPAIITATAVCGILGGVLNIFVGMVCLKEGIQALKNGNSLVGARLINDAIFCTLIGIVMILASLSSYISVLGGVGAFLTAHPWVLPLLIFIVNLPLFCEIFKGTVEIWRQQNIASKLQFNEIDKLLKEKENDLSRIHKVWKGTILDLEKIQAKFRKRKGQKYLSKTMEAIQANMGPEVALETFKLFQAVLNKDEIEAKKVMLKLKGHVSFWHKAQHVRLFQQLLFVGAFVVSMIALKPRINTRWMNASQNFGIGLACVIPLWMDSFWPFARNTPLVIRKVDVPKEDEAFEIDVPEEDEKDEPLVAT